jgi:hypothetical protein
MTDPLTGGPMPETDPENPHVPETPAHAGDVDPEDAVGIPDVDPEAPAELPEPTDAPVEFDDPGPAETDDEG